MKVEIINYSENVEKYITAAAKLCYSSAGIDDVMESINDKKEEYYIDLLTEMGHESPLEHASFTFGIEGVSRSLLAQITRHRIASFSVQSQRYVNMNNFPYVIPPEIESVPKAREEFLSAMEEDRGHYERLSSILTKENFKKFCAEKDVTEAQIIENEFAAPSTKFFRDIKLRAVKAANEDARFILPNACETKIIMTMNARSLLNFFKLRSCMRAQWEIRGLAIEMIKKIKKVSPLLFRKAGPPCVCCGFCTEGKMSCGRAGEMNEMFREMQQ